MCVIDRLFSWQMNSISSSSAVIACPDVCHALPTGLSYRVSYVVERAGAVATVPEPASLMLLASGVLVTQFKRRRSHS
jgi:hypothetical protein